MGKAKTDKIGTQTTDPEEKDFNGPGVEGKKAPPKKKTEKDDVPLTCETVIEKLRGRKYPI